MYNEERKMRFLVETRSSTGFGKSIFNTIEPYETKNGADLCQLPIEVLQPIANSNFGSRTRTSDSTIAFLRSYAIWCKEQGYEVGDGIYQLKTEMNEKMRRMMVASPMHLESILDKAFDPVQSQTIDCVYRCYLWMAFSGMDDLDTLEVKVDEINFDTMTIEHSGRSYEIYRESVPAFKMACTATEFLYDHPKYEAKMRSRFPGTHLMRGIRSDRIKITTVRGYVGKVFKENGIETSYGKIRLSGMFYKAYEMERCGIPVNFDNAVAERLAKMDHKYHKNYTRNKEANCIKRDLMEDYESWKAAFV